MTETPARPPRQQPQPADYPAQWEADVVLADGGVAHLRPIRPDDAGRLAAHFGRLSPESMYRRFFLARKGVPASEIASFVSVDYQDRVALIVLVGGQLVGVGSYDRIPGTRRAEVAFSVDDRHQGRGVGSILLEHLAAAARERGIAEFEAQVLPGNRRMAGLLTDAGYVSRRTYGDGVIGFVFPIAPTEFSESVQRSREHRAEARSIERLLRPRTVALIGASREADSIGAALLRHLVASGFTGPVYPVNPAGGTLGGRPAHRSVAEIDGTVDLAVIATPAAVVPHVVAQCAAKGVHGLVVVSAGFAESGPDGAGRQRELVDVVRGDGMRLIGPNCLGVVNTDPAVALNASLVPRLPAHGSIGFFCHAGGYGVAILEQMAARSLGVSTFVSAGNRADVSGNDLIQYWEDDPATEVVLLYLESFGNPRKFGRLARRLAARKPIVAVKGARSGDVPDYAVEALFRRAGVIRVDTISQLLDVATLLVHQPLPPGGRLAVVGNSAALARMAADACPPSVSVVATVDLGPMAGPGDLAGELAGVLADAGVDAVLVVWTPPMVRAEDDVAELLSAVAADVEKPVLATFSGFGAAGVPPAPDGTPGRRIPTYTSPEAAVHALGHAVSYARWRDAPRGSLPELRCDVVAARRLVATALTDGRTELDGDTAVQLLTAYGIGVWPGRVVGNAADAVAAAEAFGYPVAAKATAERLRHRPELGAVRLDLADASAVTAAFQALVALGEQAVLVQPMASPGVATVVELLDHPAFGPLISFGVGGVATELLGDRSWSAVPLSDVDAADLVRGVRAAPLLFGYRGSEPVDVPALEDLVLRLGRLADDLPEVCEVQLNPVIAAVRGCHVLRASVRLARSGPLPDAGPRRLA